MNLPIWTLVAGTLAWCGAALAVSFTMAAQRRQRGGLITEGRKERALMAVFLALPFVLVSGLLPWATVRVVIIFTYGWVTPCKLLLLCVANFLLDSPPWTLSRLSHFLLAMLLPVRIRDVVAEGGGRQEARRRRLKESCRSLLVEVGLLMLYLCCYDSAGELARHVTHGVVLYLVIALLHRIASMGLLVCYGVETHPAFSRPWLSESLTDFWGNRWNLTANALLRHSVYNPLVNHLLNQTSTAKNDIDIQLQQVPSSARPAKVDVVKRTLPSSSPLMSPSKPLPLWVRLVGVNTTFFISGLIHELLYFSLSQAATPTWEVTAFFIVHGLATSAEITLRQRAGSSVKYVIASIPRPIKVAVTLSFVYATTAFLAFPQLVRAGMFSTLIHDLRTVSHTLKRSSLFGQVLVLF